MRPGACERRAGSDRRRACRPTADRRQVAERRPVLPNEMHQGWLAFSSSTERRRLAPVPANWVELSDAELQRLADAALRLSHGLRLVREGPA